MKYLINLNVKSPFNFNKSFIFLNSYIKFLKENNIEYFCLNNDQHVFNVINILKKIDKFNLKPIIGTNLYIFFKKKKFLITYFFFSFQEYLNLNFLLNLRKNINIEEYKKYFENIKIIINFNFIDNELITFLKSNKIIYFIVYKKELFLKNTNLPFIFFNPVFYINSSYNEIFDFYKKTINLNLNYVKEEKFNYLNSEEYKFKFNFLIKNKFFDIYSKLKFNIFFFMSLSFDIKKFFNDFKNYNFEIKSKSSNNNYNNLLKLIDNGWKKLSLRISKNLHINYLNQIKKELLIFKNKNLLNYLLILKDLINFLNKKNIYYGNGRGSSVGSLILYILKITKIDPIKNNLLFERFINIESLELPDIDIDVENEKLNEIFLYLKKKYKNVFNIIVFKKNNILDFLTFLKKKYNLSQLFLEKIKKLNFSKFKNIKEIYNSSLYLNSTNKIYKLIIKLLFLYNKMFSGFSIHPAGKVILNNNYFFLFNRKDTLFLDKKEVQSINLFKFDFLSSKYLFFFKKIVEKIKKKEKNFVINYNDKKVFNFFSKLEFYNIFQINSVIAKNIFSKIKLNSIFDISQILSLIRPGSFKYINQWIMNFNKNTSYTFINKEISKILNYTNGIILFQEQLLSILNIITIKNISNNILIRKFLFKKDISNIEIVKKIIFENLKNKFQNNDNKFKLWNLFLQSSKYSFNKNHSIAYSYFTYELMYLKYYYWKDFQIILLNNNFLNYSTLFNFFLNISFFNYNFIFFGVDINISTNKFFFKNNKLIFPFSIILKEEVIKNILKIRKNKLFLNIFDFLFSLKIEISKEDLKKLIIFNAFEKLEISKNILLENINFIWSTYKTFSYNYILKNKYLSKLIKKEKKEIFFENYFFLNKCFILKTKIRLKENINFSILNDKNIFFYKKLIFLVKVKNIIKTKYNNEIINVVDESGEFNLLNQFNSIKVEKNKYYIFHCAYNQNKKYLNIYKKINIK